MATRRLVGASNQIFAMLLAHLAEVETRGLHRERACSSLYTYCIYELRFSEDAAYRRVSASRLVKRFPILYQAIASGELHLTGLLMLGPHLTPENHLEVLARAKHRTKTELTKLLRTLDPFQEVPGRIEPLAPAPAARAKANPSWGDYVAAWAPVRYLEPGDAPRDWMNDELPETTGAGPAPARSGTADLTPDEPAPARSGECQTELAPSDAQSSAEAEPSRGQRDADEPAFSEPTPARSGTAPVTGPLRYGVQFSADEEYVQLVERAKALLAHAHGKSSLEEIHLRAMRLLVADLEERRFAKVARPRRKANAGAAKASESEGVDSSVEPNGTCAPNEGTEALSVRSRYIPAAVRREVFERDEARCTFVDSTGQRCRETHGLEMHHLRAFAQGGGHDACNLTLRCRAHNALAAEVDFGRDFMAKKRGETS